jgi:hypothetical protein
VREDHDRQFAGRIGFLNDEALQQDQPALDRHSEKALLDAIALFGRHLHGERSSWRLLGRCCGRGGSSASKRSERDGCNVLHLKPTRLPW